MASGASVENYSSKEDMYPRKEVLQRYTDMAFKWSRLSPGELSDPQDREIAEIIKESVEIAKNKVKGIIEAVCDKRDWKGAIETICSMSMESKRREFIERSNDSRIEHLQASNTLLEEELENVRSRLNSSTNVADTNRLRFMIDNAMSISHELSLSEQKVNTYAKELESIQRLFKFDDFPVDTDVPEGESGDHVCDICTSRKKQATLSCGHEMCATCAGRVWEEKPECPFCKELLICVIKRHT